MIWLNVVLLFLNIISLHGGNYEIRTFYRTVAYYVGRDINKAISYLYINDDFGKSRGIDSLYSTLFHFQAESKQIMDRALESKEDMCLAFELYRDAIDTMLQFRDMRDAIGDMTDLDRIDRVHDIWQQKCPVYITYPTNQLVSMFYIPSGKYLSHSLNDKTACCQERDKVDDWENNFYLKPWVESEMLLYGDNVAVGYKGVYLSNEGDNMNWYRSWMSGWEKFRVENFCRPANYETYGVVRMFDLVMFHSMDEDGHYWKFKGRTYSRGPYHFILLYRNGTFPSIKID